MSTPRRKKKRGRGDVPTGDTPEGPEGRRPGENTLDNLLDWEWVKVKRAGEPLHYEKNKKLKKDSPVDEDMRLGTSRLSKERKLKGLYTG